MNNWIRVGLPIGLGLLAGVMNWVSVQSKLKPVAFTAINRSIVRGEKISPHDLVRVEVAGDTRRLLKGVLPWKERSTVYETLAARDLFDGDLVLLRDATPHLETRLAEHEEKVTFHLPNNVPISQIFAGQSVSFLISNGRRAARETTSHGQGTRARSSDARRVLGPYRVAAVSGDHAGSLVGEDARTREGEHSLSIIVRLNSELKVSEEVRRLLGATHTSGEERIVGVLVRGKNTPARTLTSNLAASNVSF